MFCLALAMPAAAQSALTGIVHDPDGRVAVGATVVVFEDLRGQRWVATVSAIGYYEIDLPAGEYHVFAYRDRLAFAGAVTVYPHEKTAFDIDLQAYGHERVTVEGTIPRADTFAGDATAQSASFSHAAIDLLPLANGRTLQSLISLVPAIVFTDSVGTLAQFTAIGQRRFANRLVIDGVEADLAVDVRGQGVGAAASGALPAFSSTGSTQTLIPLAAIEEMQVHTTNTPTPQQRTPGAQTIVVTRAGSDRLTGMLSAEGRPAGLEASDWFTQRDDAPRRPHALVDVSASGGGPILPRRVFAFAAWERQRIDRPLAVDTRVPSIAARNAAAPAVQAILDAFPRPTGDELGGGLADFSALVPARSDLSTVSLRVDAPLTPQHHLFARVNRGVSTGDALGDLREQPTISFTSTESTKTTTATAGLTSVWPSLAHELRVNFSRHEGTTRSGAARYANARVMPLDLLADRDDAVRVDVFPGGFLIDGLTGASTQRQVQFVDTWTWVRGGHEFQAGADIRRLTAATDPPAARYTYNFNNLVTAPYSRPQFMTMEWFTPARARLQTWAAFVQDTARLSSRTSVQFGMRASRQPAPVSLTGTQPLVFEETALPALQAREPGAPLWRTPPIALSPHVEGSYRLDARPGRASTIRAGWSLVHDDTIAPGVAAFGRAYPFAETGVLHPATFPVPAAVLDSLQRGDSFENATIADAYAVPAHLQTPWTQQWHVTIDRALGSAQQISVGYVGAAGRRLFYGYTQFLDTSHTIEAFNNDGTSDYHALLVEFVRRASRHVDGRLAYTWSHAIDLDSGETIGANLPPSVALPRNNRGSADFDRRHVLRGLLSYHVEPFSAPRWMRIALEDWRFDVVGLVTSGAPVTVSVTQDDGYVSRLDAVPDVPVWIDDPASPTGKRLNSAAFLAFVGDRHGNVGRNTFYASTLRQLDLALSRTFRIRGRTTVTCRVDVFNALNIPNFGPPLGILDGTRFGEPAQTYAQALGTGTLTFGGLVPLQQTGGPRSVQFGLRLGW